MKQRNTLSVLLVAALAAVGAGSALAATQVGDTGRAARPQLDANNDGAIDRTEAAAHPRLAAKFDQLDANKDGKLDASERPHRKGGRGGHRGHGGMDGLVSADADGDGRISRTEAASLPWLGKHVRRHRPQPRRLRRPQRAAQLPRAHAPAARGRARQGAEERFVAADLNHDGKLSKVEVSEKMPRMSKSFAFMDEDRDGFLTREDLKPSPRH